MPAQRKRHILISIKRKLSDVLAGRKTCSYSTFRSRVLEKKKKDVYNRIVFFVVV